MWKCSIDLKKNSWKRISLQFELSSRISGILSNTFCQIRCQKRTSRGRPPNTQAPRPSPLPSSWRQRQPFIHLCWKQRAFCIEAGLCAVLCLVCIAKPWLYPSSSSHHAKPHNLCGHPAKITSKWCAWRKSITHHGHCVRSWGINPSISTLNHDHWYRLCNLKMACG